MDASKAHEPITGRVMITGGNGFVGRGIQESLKGRPLRILARDPSDPVAPIDPATEVVEGDVTDPASLAGTFDDCEAVIHLVAIIEESGDATFDRVIRQGTDNVLEEAKRAGVRQFLLQSALGVRDDPHYPYFAAKWHAEQAVKKAGIPWTIFRPSLIFGPGDGFFTLLADLVKKAPVIPVAGDGESKFQPIHVSEVADAFRRALDDPGTIGKIYELGGPDILTYDQVIDIIARQLGTSRRKVHLPVGLVKAVVTLSGPLPKAIQPPVTLEQLKMLDIDNCTDNSATPDLIDRPLLPLAGNIDYLSR